MLALLTCLRKPPLPVRRRPADAAADEAPRGCGWFDSSHELQHGLLVTEHASADAVAADLPLADWLSMHLSGWRADALGA